MIEPAILFSLSIGKLDNEVIEKIGMANQKAKIVVLQWVLQEKIGA